MVGLVKKEERSLVDRCVDFIFSNDPRKWLLLILLLGVILRVLVASHVPPVADEMVHGVHAIGVSKLAPLSTMTQGPVWFYLTDYAYRIMGIDLLSARILSVIFGSLTIVVVYLLGNLLWGNKKISLIAAFLLAISAYHITWAASYQDETMMFFVLLAAYFFIKTYKEEKTISLLSAALLGVALLVKIITGVFILVFTAFTLGILIRNFMYDRALFWKNFKKALIFAAIILIAMLPVFSYNYFLYKEKGIVDLVFAQFLRINPDFYTGPGLAHEEGFVLAKLPHNLYSVITHYFLKEDALISILGALGMLGAIVAIKKKSFGERFMLASCLFALVFIAASIVLQTHYTSFFPFFALFGAAFIGYASEKEWWSEHKKHVVWGIIAVVLVYNVWSIQGAITSGSATGKMRDFVEKSIDTNTLVLADSRIYVGTYTWMFNDRAYISANQLSVLMQLSNESGQVVPVKTAFVECVNDDCGWGTIKDQPELNESMENLAAQFKAATRMEEINGGGSIKGVRGEEVSGQPYYRVYTVNLPLNPGVLQLVKQTHNHFFYHIPRDENPEQQFDYYSVNGGTDNLINMLAYLVLYVMLFLSVVSMAAPFYLMHKETN